MSSDLVIVYHRQPYEEVEVDGKIELRENSSPNGIVPTLKSFFGRVQKASWVAWKYADDPSNPGFERVVEIDDSYGKYSVSRLPLTPEQVQSFYHVSSKEAFWPILHGFKERYNYDPVDWPTFRQVNWAFAEAAAEEASDDAVVWIHDYNLWLVPGYLRQLKPNVKIAFFHHTPFPNPDMFNVLPWREEIVKSLLTADAVGFHISRYSNNFKAVARSISSARTTDEMPTPQSMTPSGMALSERNTVLAMRHHDHDIIIDTSPVGVDTDYIATLAADPEVRAKADEIRRDLGDCQLIISVARTDYTKGNVEQLEAFERLLIARPDLKGKVRLMHVSVGANRNMTAYEEVQQRIEELTGRINGTFGSFEWQPVSLISTAIPFRDLIAYYRAADVAWITPLADGLNLVANEFCSARDDLSGALVLSEFAGTAVLLNGAVPVNPFSHASMDRGIQQALDMDADERRGRMERMRACVKAFDINAWVASQTDLFDRLRKLPSKEIKK